MEKEKKNLKGEEGQHIRLKFIVISIIRVLLIISFIGAYLNNRELILFISIIAFAITFLPVLLKKVFGIDIPAQFEIIVLLFIYGTLFFGKVKGFYSEFWWWGILLSTASAIALGFVGLIVMYSLYKGDRINGSPLIIAFFSFCFAVAVGALWELFESSLDWIFGFSLQQSGRIMTDMAANMAGAFFVSSAGYYYIKNGRIILISGLISKFIEKNPRIFGSLPIEERAQKILKLIEGGESDKVEFKSTLRTNLHINQIDKKMEHIVLKTIVAYLNSNGGTLLVGVSDDGKILGTGIDGFPDNDSLNLHFTSLIKECIGTEYLPFIQHELIPIDGKHILKIECEPSNKHVFLQANGTEEFFVRNGPSTVRLEGSALVDYVNHKFNRIEGL